MRFTSYSKSRDRGFARDAVMQAPMFEAMTLKSNPFGRPSLAGGTVVWFPMFSGDVLVPCSITASALHALGRIVGIEFLALEHIFERLRPLIECIASEKYDRGSMVGDGVIIRNADV